MTTYNEMKKKAESDQDRIELRSEKVRNMTADKIYCSPPTILIAAL